MPDYSVQLTLEGKQHLTAMVAYPDGRIVLGCSEGKIWVWDVASNELRGLSTMHRVAVTAFIILPDGRLVSAGKKMYLWNLDLTTVEREIGHHQQAITSLCLLKDGRLVSGSEGKIKFWRLEETGSQQACLDMQITVGTFHGGTDHGTDYHDMAEVGHHHELHHHSEHHKVYALRESPGNQLLCGLASVLRVYRLEEMEEDTRKREAKQAKNLEKISYHLSTAFMNYEANVAGTSHGSAYVLAELSHHQIVIGGDGVLKLIFVGANPDGVDTCLITELKTLETAHREKIRSLLVLPDERVLSADWGGTLKLWSPDLLPLATFKRRTQPILGLALLPEGRIAMAYVDGVVQLFGIEVALHQMNALREAIVRNDEPGVRALLQEGVALNDCFSNGRSPLDIAQKLERTEIVHLLLSRGAEPEKRLFGGSKFNRVEYKLSYKSRHTWRKQALEDIEAKATIIDLAGDWLSQEELSQLVGKLKLRPQIEKCYLGYQLIRMKPNDFRYFEERFGSQRLPTNKVDQSHLLQPPDTQGSLCASGIHLGEEKRVQLSAPKDEEKRPLLTPKKGGI